MQVKDLLKIKGLKQITNNVSLDMPISDLYTGDLLSWVMGHVREENCCLLTVLNSINVIAVASLLELSAIVFCEGVIPTDDIVAKANEEKINLFTSLDTTYHTAREIENYESLL